MTPIKQRLFRPLAAAAIAAALSACAAQPQGSTPAEETAATPPAPAPEPEKAAPEIKPAQEEQKIARLPDAAVNAPPQPRIRPVPIAKTLMGRNRDGVTKALGEPSFQRKEPPAEIWQYRGERCILDVFFMPREGTLKVTHVAIRGYGVAKVAEPDCMADLAAERDDDHPG